MEIRMIIQVCIGSSCHVRGSYKVLEAIKDQVEKHDLQHTVNVQIAFCLGVCTSGDTHAEGVAIKVDEDLIAGVTPENAEQVFASRVLTALA